MDILKLATYCSEAKMRVKITPGRAKGHIQAPPSKSMAHRMLIAAAMADGESLIKGVSECDDVRATLSCLESLGVRIEKNGSDYRVFGTDFKKITHQGELFCRESGSTIRMLIPPATLSGNTVCFTASEGLLKRPMTPYKEIYEDLGFLFERTDRGYLVKGSIPAGEYTIPGNLSSQFISGLIFALAALKGESIIKITPPIESRSYIDMTLEAIKHFSATAFFEDDLTIRIKGGGYKACEACVEGDYSGAAFPYALNLLGGEVEISGLSESSSQGDKVYREYFRLLSLGTPEIDISDCPDLGPILFAMAAAKGGARFTGTKRLKVKESDRAAAMAEELSKLGISLLVEENSVTVESTKLCSPTEPIHSHNDHRIVMATAILLTQVGGEIIGAEAINKSYPDFFKDLMKLNIDLEIYE